MPIISTAFDVGPTFSAVVTLSWDGSAARWIGGEMVEFHGGYQLLGGTSIPLAPGADRVHAILADVQATGGMLAIERADRVFPDDNFQRLMNKVKRLMETTRVEGQLISAAHVRGVMPMTAAGTEWRRILVQRESPKDREIAAVVEAWVDGAAEAKKRSGDAQHLYDAAGLALVMVALRARFPMHQGVLVLPPAVAAALHRARVDAQTAKAERAWGGAVVGSGTRSEKKRRSDAARRGARTRAQGKLKSS